MSIMEYYPKDGIGEIIDDIVRNNRRTIAFVFPILGSIIMIASANLSGIPEIVRFNPLLILIGVIVMRLPLISGILPLIKRRSLLIFSFLILYTYAIEIIAVKTGYPYGEFEYGVSLGPMLLDIPLALPLFFIPLVLNSYILCVLLFDCSEKVIYRVPMVVIVVLIIDMILDPAAVSIGFWTYESGIYYNVPVSNYAGWVLSATVATLLIDFAFDYEELKEQSRNCDYLLDDLVSFTILWGMVNLFYLSIVPAILTGIVVLALFISDDFNFAV